MTLSPEHKTGYPANFVFLTSSKMVSDVTLLLHVGPDIAADAQASAIVLVVVQPPPACRGKPLQSTSTGNGKTITIQYNTIQYKQCSVQHTVLYPTRLDCSAILLYFSMASPLSRNQKCVSNPTNSTVVSCLYLDIRHII